MIRLSICLQFPIARNLDILNRNNSNTFQQIIYYLSKKNLYHNESLNLGEQNEVYVTCYLPHHSLRIQLCIIPHREFYTRVNITQVIRFPLVFFIIWDYLLKSTLRKTKYLQMSPLTLKFNPIIAGKPKRDIFIIREIICISFYFWFWF